MAVDYTIEDVWTLPGNNGIDGRFHDGAFLALPGPVGSPMTTYRDGVLPGSWSGTTYVDLQVLPDSPTPGMAVRCNLGQFVVGRAGQGPYVGTLRSTGRVDLDAASTTNPRRDLIVMQVLDASIGDADTRGRLWRVTGTPGGAPTLPAVPTGAIPLAEVQVAANATQITGANIIDLRRAAGLRGAVRLMMPGDSHSDPGIYPGDSRYCRTHQQVEVWRADSLWHGTQPISYQTVGAVASGSVTGSPVAISIAVPDPGFPYYLEASGALAWDQGVSTVYAPVVQTSTGTEIARGLSIGTGAMIGVGSNRSSNVSTRRAAAVQTGARTVQLVLQRDPASTDPASGVQLYSGGAFNYLHVKVVPA